MAGLGTAINVGTIVAGTAIGLVAGGRIPERTRTTVLQAVGLVVVALGVGEAVKTHNLVFPLVAIVAGAVIGEAIRLEDRLESLGERIRRRVEGGRIDTPAGDDAEVEVDVEVEGGAGAIDAGRTRRGTTSFVEGFVAASLLFCVGPLAILGSIRDGLTGDVQVLAVKAALDGLVSVIFAATLGWGVGFAAIPVLVYQGVLTIAAGAADRVLDQRMIIEMTATGGIMVMGIGLRLLELRQVRVGSLLPALLIAPALVALFAR